jgi:UDP-N-acetylglucosamine 2-epimerase (non-hydrolysing)
MKQYAIDLVAAARPNFMKVAPLYKALRAEGERFAARLIHTGQHYDDNMSGAFFRDLQLPQPDAHLCVGSGSHAEQTGNVMIAYEKHCRSARPDWVVVVGDVNSTLACTLAAVKLGIPVIHLEAGLRSGDRGMPEEINRLATDAIADVLWTPSSDADANLLREGVAPERISRVGNIMIDALELCRARIEACRFAMQLGMQKGRYGVVTLHRPSNVDDRDQLALLVELLVAAATDLPLVFPVHPRTRARLAEFGLLDALTASGAVRCIEPVGYIEFMSLVFGSVVAVTDSGGVQEETTYLGIPCLTLRDTTERPITVSEGTNRLIKPRGLPGAIEQILRGAWPKGRRPELWDGATATRAVQDLKRRLAS